MCTTTLKNQIRVSLLLLSFALSLNATTFNPIFPTALQNRSDKHIQVLLTRTDHLIFHRKEASDQGSIVSLDLSNSTTTELISYDHSQLNRSSKIVQLNNGQLVFVARIGNNKQLYQSNGIESFEAITAADLEGTASSQSVNDFLFFKRNDGALVWTNGITTQAKFFDENVRPLCVFNTDHIIFSAGSELKLYKNDLLTPILTEYLYQNSGYGAAHTSDACIIKFTDDNNNSQQLYVNQNGSSVNTNRNDNQVFAINNQFLTINKPNNSLDSTTPTQLNILGESGVEVLHSYQVPPLLFHNLKVRSNRILLYTYTNTDRNQRNLSVLDPSLNALAEPILISKFDDPFSSLDLDLVVHEDQLKIYNNGLYQNQLPFNEQLQYNFYTNKLTNTVVFSDENLYLLSELPNIGSQINGPWYDVNFENQGLSINPGQRTDGSNYIFLTYFLYRDGEPLWLAGNQNYIPSQTDISIDLFEYSGAGFLDTTVTPDREVFGAINLRFNSCDGLDGTVEFDNQTQILDFRRVDDTSFNSRCVMP